MCGAIAAGISSALAGGAMSKVFGCGQKAASGGIQADLLATNNSTEGMGDAGSKSANEGSTVRKCVLSGYGSVFVYISGELLAQARPRAIGWMSVEDPFAMRNNEIRLRHDTAARAELGCAHFAGIFALGASVDLFTSIGIANI